MRWQLFVFGLLLFGTLAAEAQYRRMPATEDAGTVFRGQPELGLRGLRGLVDPARMHMSHSLFFGVASIGGRSVSEGLYVNRMDYQLVRPLWLTTYLGYRFQPSGPAEWNPARNGSSFTGGADLTWRPTSNALFRFSVYRGMYSEYPYGGWGWGSYEFDRPAFARP